MNKSRSMDNVRRGYTYHLSVKMVFNLLLRRYLALVANEGLDDTHGEQSVGRLSTPRKYMRYLKPEDRRENG